jgi:hypothetical protein
MRLSEGLSFVVPEGRPSRAGADIAGEILSTLDPSGWLGSICGQFKQSF